MNKKLLLTCFLFLGTLLNFSSLDAAKMNEWDVHFKIKGLAEGQECLIAYYYGDKQYIKDTLISGKNGELHWRNMPGEDGLHGGIYLFVTPTKNYFEFLFVEPKFTMETDITEMVAKMKVTGSEENKIFYEYLAKIDPMQKEAAKLRGDAEKNKDRLGEIDKEVIAIKEKLVADHPKAFISKVFMAAKDPEVPEDAPKGEDGEIDKTWQYHYLVKHYWDNVDLQDDRMMYAPVYAGRLKQFINRWVVQHPDSIVLAADKVIRKTEGTEEMFKFTLITILNIYAGTKKMCFDKVYVHLTEKYYITGKADWVSEEQMEKIKDRYYKMRYNVCDQKAVNLLLEDLEGKQFDIYSVKAPWTVLVFWDYECSHCKKVMPKVGEFYKEFKQHGVEVISINTKSDKEKVKKFIEEKELPDWKNGMDPEHKTNFRIFYDIYSTPVIYLLDKDKKIVAKRLDVENLRKYLNHELGIEELEGDLEMKDPGEE